MPTDMTAIVMVKYQFIDDYHIFTSEDVYGLYVASKNPEKAFNNVQGSIEKLIKLNDGLDIEVEPVQTYREFLREPAISHAGEAHIPHPAITQNTSRTFLVKRAA